MNILIVGCIYSFSGPWDWRNEWQMVRSHNTLDVVVENSLTGRRTDSVVWAHQIATSHAEKSQIKSLYQHRPYYLHQLLLQAN